MFRSRSLRSHLSPALLLLPLLALFFPGPAQAGPPTEPILRMETMMHTAKIKNIDSDRAGRYLITASNDKTARIWEIKTGRLLRVLRPPLGPDEEGRLDACAMSPDGKLVVVGGWTGFGWDKKCSIYIFDRASGRLIRRLIGLPNVVWHLAFSPDGSRLAATLGDKNGVRVFRTSDWSLLFQDRDYGESSYWADFSKDNRLVTTCLDHQVRLYDKKGRLLKKAAPGGEKEPLSAVFSPDGTRIAVGHFVTTKVNLVSGRDLGLITSLTTKSDEGNLGHVAWSPDGRYLYAGGAYDEGGRNLIRRWDKGGRGGFTDLQAAWNTISGIEPLTDGRLVFGSQDPAWGVFDPRGKKIIHKGPSIADHRGLLKHFRTSGDGSIVEFAYWAWKKDPARLDIRHRHLEQVKGHGPGLSEPRTGSISLRVKDWSGKYHPELNGQPLKVKKYERASSLALMPDDSGLLLGTSWYLRFYDAQGKEKWNVPVPSTAWAVNVAPNGKVCLAALGDGTIRWYRVGDGEELLAFFPHKDRKRWVLWTPKGYYDCSPGADQLIGWHLNQGAAKEADFFPASHFREMFYRPEVVARILSALDEKEAVRLADQSFNRRHREMDIRKKLPPVVRIVSPRDNQQISARKVTLGYTLRSPSGLPVTSIRALVNGRPVIAETKPLTIGKKDEIRRTIRVPVPPWDVEVSLLAACKDATSRPDTVRLRWKQPGQTQGHTRPRAKPRLYVLAIGISDYPGTRLDLRFAAKDARDFSRVVSRQRGLLYRDVQIRILTDRKATKGNILDGLEWIQAQTTRNDVAMIFLSGHGVNDKFGDYYFLPGDVKPKRLRRTALPFMEIKKTVVALAGKALFFVDSCHSGNVLGARRGPADINAVINELASAEAGAVVFSSSTGRQVSLENQAWGNGAFTKALVEALSGRADYIKSGFSRGKITVNEIDLYISDQVRRMTHGRQTPSTAKPRTITDFPVALVR